MSGNSVFNNDENLLEIKGSRLIRIYLAEFLRLELYRARACFIELRQREGGTKASPLFGFSLVKSY